MTEENRRIPGVRRVICEKKQCKLEGMEPPRKKQCGGGGGGLLMQSEVNYIPLEAPSKRELAEISAREAKPKAKKSKKSTSKRKKSEKFMNETQVGGGYFGFSEHPKKSSTKKRKKSQTGGGKFSKVRKHSMLK